MTLAQMERGEAGSAKPVVQYPASTVPYMSKIMYEWLGERKAGRPVVVWLAQYGIGPIPGQVEALRKIFGEDVNVVRTRWYNWTVEPSPQEVYTYVSSTGANAVVVSLHPKNEAYAERYARQIAGFLSMFGIDVPVFVPIMRLVGAPESREEAERLALEAPEKRIVIPLGGRFYVYEFVGFKRVP